MMRIVGIAIIAFSGFLLGFLYYIKIKQRPLELEMFLNLIDKYLTELKWDRKSLKEVINEFNYPKFNDYINEVRVLLKDNDYVYAFVDGNKYFNNMHLLNEEIIVIRNLFETTGQTGYDLEINICEKTRQKIADLKQQAENSFKKSGALILKLSIIICIWIFILLI